MKEIHVNALSQVLPGGHRALWVPLRVHPSRSLHVFVILYHIHIII